MCRNGVVLWRNWSEHISVLVVNTIAVIPRRPQFSQSPPLQMQCASSLSTGTNSITMAKLSNETLKRSVRSINLWRVKSLLPPPSSKFIALHSYFHGESSKVMVFFCFPFVLTFTVQCHMLCSRSDYVAHPARPRSPKPIKSYAAPIGLMLMKTTYMNDFRMYPTHNSTISKAEEYKGPSTKMETLSVYNGEWWKHQHVDSKHKSIV